ncbi:MAG: hypothetical protein LBT74_11955 [Acidobacteriota bacterium]|nr:hypothetical protein [Acidobacteriota bacterium]
MHKGTFLSRLDTLLDGTGTSGNTRHAVAIALGNWVEKKTLVVAGNSNQVWTFNNTDTATTITAPDGGQTTHTFVCKDDASDFAATAAGARVQT